MDIKQTLRSQLSSETSILTPSDEAWTSVAARWNSSFSTSYSVIVDASCEEDVASAIKYANANNIPFLAFNGTHGAQLPLNKFKDGLGITLLAMRSITPHEEDGGQTVWIRGSWLSGHVRDEVEKLGKRTTVGLCESTGLMGPMLGGGHGVMQGRYGLLADQVVELRLVLADGSLVTASENENQDLFWAMRGAGHNFGVVTAMRYKVYDIPNVDEWAFGSMVFKGEQLEDLVPVFNKLLENQPVEAAMWFPQIMMRPDLDPAKPVIMVNFLHEGPISALEAFSYQLTDFPNLFSEVKPITYLEASKALDWHFDSFSNQKGISVYRFPVGATSFSYASMKETYDIFTNALIAQPMFGYSFVIWESYSTQGVKAVADDATAVADRGDDMLVAPMVIMPPGTPPGSDLLGEAEKFGQRLRKAIVGDGEHHAYVNYAHGDETLKQIYGHESWRLDKLRKLKKQYDPENKFGYYSPIV